VFAAAAGLGLWGLTRGEEPGPAPTPAAPAPAGPAPAEPLRAARIPLEGEIGETLLTSTRDRADQAVRDGCRLLVFDISSYGGMATVGLDLSREVERIGRQARTVAYVDAKAISAAALVAMSCQEIVMTPEASIGDCAPILVGPEGIMHLEGVEREKFETALRERMASLAEKHGLSPALGKAMVTMQVVVVRAVNKRTGEVRYIEEDDLFGLGADWEKRETIDGPDELLTVGGKQAKAFGIARHLVGRFDDLYDLYPIAGRVTVYPMTWQETVVLWMNNMYLKALLVLIGLIGIYIEMSTPGFGVPGTVAIVCFGLVFLASFLAGAPKWLPLLLVLAGGTMLAIEVFVTPGFGLLGSVGILLLLAGIVLLLPPFQGLPHRAFEYQELLRSLGVTAGILVAFLLAALALARYLPRVPLLGKLVLAPSSVSDGSSRAAAAQVEALARVGDAGRAATKLRPAGKVRFGHRLVDVMTEGDFLDAGTEVVVLEVRGNRIVVAPKERPEA
jgi:membrane-bound serine protease (ClpP class)